MAQDRPNRTLGAGHNEFWDWCGKGELCLQKCDACGEVAWPVVKACEHCAGTAFSWQRMSGRGTVAGWCTFERDYCGGIMPVPYDTILVALEEGPLFLSNPQGFDWHETTVGMPVRLSFTPCRDAGGEFSLPVFERA